ncbi:SLC13 family permease [Edwardsiella anguillarum]|uniref:SLC13 family permease n=1 Tax=Edwardsiella anguillarum TaxID=1821960 RepID=UPI0024B85332|nr:SLC13 family permease [Edwardsiella anguillarum]WHP81743.1 anion permease [Edwardsiella anguillarum]WHQ19245.1 anion permease [Edwardsiella anguillarum]WHQ22790.1 anion permease [Edwardsiella anguillarum]WHQ26313.1 anion permease [Edwardsiella anguillarum]WHQ29828.1 anion permease [Edwardsiella anguillarum]
MSRRYRATARHLASLLRDPLLLLPLLLVIALLPFTPLPLSSLPAAIDWHTIITLTGLLLLSKGVENSGYLDWLGQRIIARLHSERATALLLVIASLLLAAVLTNDVALFIVIPLTLALKKLANVAVTRLIVLEALAVNVGSLLTPIGNPQNILLWGRSGWGFWPFIAQMLPLAATLSALLLLLTYLSTPRRRLRLPNAAAPPDRRRRQLWSCLALYPLFIAAIDAGYPAPGLLLLAAVLLYLAPTTLRRIDWPLLAVFILMFIDVRLLISLPPLEGLCQRAAQMQGGALYLAAIALSQLISNVPATILLLGIQPPSLPLAYGVNIGGFGFALGSMANLIALRMAGGRRIWGLFHLYSLPALLLAALLGGGLL